MGYNTSSERGADTFSPFSNISELKSIYKESPKEVNQHSTYTFTFTNMIVGKKYYSMFLRANGFYPIFASLVSSTDCTYTLNDNGVSYMIEPTSATITVTVQYGYSSVTNSYDIPKALLLYFEG